MLSLSPFYVNKPFFRPTVQAGTHNIRRSGHDSNVAIPDRKSFGELIEQADAAASSGSELDLGTVRSCGQPERLLLPKGNEEGLKFWLNVYVTSGDDGAHDDLHENDHGGNHGYCGIRGEKYPDKRPMGFPFERRIPDLRVLKDLPNFFGKVVRVYHKDNH